MQRLETRSGREVRRPRSVTATLWILGFLGITALGGGIEMLLFPKGNDYLPASFLDEIPIVDTFIVPGLVLAAVFGLGSLFLTWGVARRSELPGFGWIERRTGRHWSWLGTVAIGICFTAWMVIEIALLSGPSDSETTGEVVTGLVLWGIYGLVAVALLVLPQLKSFKEYLDHPVDPRHILRATP